MVVVVEGWARMELDGSSGREGDLVRDAIAAISKKPGGTKLGKKLMHRSTRVSWHQLGTSIDRDVSLTMEDNVNSGVVEKASYAIEESWHAGQLIEGRC